MYPQFLVSEYNHPLYVLILYVEIWKVQKQKKKHLMSHLVLLINLITFLKVVL